MTANYFIFDKNKCVGCEACIIACINENGFQYPELWRNVHSSNPEKYPGLPLFYLSMSCNHCENAVCMDNCPALAYARSLISGTILHNQDACIGCKYCTWNCPYDTPKYNPFKGIIEKCNFCETRLINKQKPACASLCPTGALDFSFDKIDKSKVETSLKTPINTKPSIVIKETRKQKAPRIDQSLFSDVEIPENKTRKDNKISPAKEWTLIVFTLIVSVMTAIATSGFLNQAELKIKILFLTAGALAAFLSTIHLGKPLRAWRALLNIKKSWLSREILFFTLFYFSQLLNILFFKVPWFITIILSILLLYSIDRLYKPVQVHWKNKIHSAQVLFIALSFYLILNNLYLYWFFIMILRLYLFSTQSLKTVFSDKFKISIRIVRILSIFLTGLFIISSYPYSTIIITFSAGEIIDRILFYDELEQTDVKKLIKTTESINN